MANQLANELEFERYYAWLGAKHELYTLELFETLTLATGSSVMRVPGGWIFDMWNLDLERPKTGIFIPYSDEFQLTEHEIFVLNNPEEYFQSLQEPQPKKRPFEVNNRERKLGDRREPLPRVENPQQEDLETEDLETEDSDDE